MIDVRKEIDGLGPVIVLEMISHLRESWEKVARRIDKLSESDAKSLKAYALTNRDKVSLAVGSVGAVPAGLSAFGMLAALCNGSIEGMAITGAIMAASIGIVKTDNFVANLVAKRRMPLTKIQMFRLNRSFKKMRSSLTNFVSETPRHTSEFQFEEAWEIWRADALLVSDSKQTTPGDIEHRISEISLVLDAVSQWQLPNGEDIAQIVRKTDEGPNLRNSRDFPELALRSWPSQRNIFKSNWLRPPQQSALRLRNLAVAWERV